MLNTRDAVQANQWSRTVLAIGFVALSASPGGAQSAPADQPNADLAKQLSNPIASLVSVP